MYYERHETLPGSLDDLRAEPNVYFDRLMLDDAGGEQSIVYNKIDESRFELCAEFRIDSGFGDYDRSPASPVYYGGRDYKAGYNCIEGVLWTVLKPAAKY